jgi:hypothetical protein
LLPTCYLGRASDGKRLEPRSSRSVLA